MTPKSLFVVSISYTSTYEVLLQRASVRSVDRSATSAFHQRWSPSSRRTWTPPVGEQQARILRRFPRHDNRQLRRTGRQAVNLELEDGRAARQHGTQPSTLLHVEPTW